MNLVITQSRAPLWPLPGSDVSVPIILGYRHRGIVSDRFYDGKPMVISNSARAGGVHEEPWDEFSQGKLVNVEEMQSGTSHWKTIRRARSRIGTPYDLLTWNCEHLVGFAKGLSPSSPQVSVTVALVSLGLVLAARKGA